MMKRFLSVLCIVTLGASLPAMAETTWTFNGPKGGTASGGRDCAGGGNGSYACSGQSTYVGPEGRTATRTWQGTGTATGGARHITTTGPNGQTFNGTRSWQRGN
jgi:hypothetical protein